MFIDIYYTCDTIKNFYDFTALEIYFYFYGGKMKMFSSRKNLCSKCPYKLGIIKTLINPCPECKLNGYQSYEWFRKQLSGETKKLKMEKE